MWGALKLPAAFSDQAAESRFLLEFRASGLRLAKIAFVLAAMMAFAFWLVLAVAPTANQASVTRQIVRIGLFVILASTAAYLHLYERLAIQRFRASVGLPMAVACLVVGLMGMVPLDSGDLGISRFPVAMSLTCWLCYGFTRLPTPIVAVACVPASVLTLVGSSLQGDDHVLALGIYLGVANLIGWIMSVEIERRERALFWSSRQLAEATRALEEMARNAADADAAKTRVLAAVSHDLRQPLASLALYAQLLRARNDVLRPSGLADTVERLDACVLALSGNLDRLTELSGLREHGVPLPVGPTDLRPVLGRLEGVYSAEATRRGVRLVVRLPRPGREYVTSNENRLSDILSNLTGNALKFASPARPAWVVIRTRRIGARIVVEVCDNGIGIAPADQRRVFDEYFQVANHARKPEHGHGLGLSIVREAVSCLPGHALVLRSRSGRGTRFALTLPASMAPDPRGAALGEGREAGSAAAEVADAGSDLRSGVRLGDPYPSGGAPRVADVRGGPVREFVSRDVESDAYGAEPLAGAYVLLIEDDDTMRDALGRVLQQWGALVDVAASGEEALALVARAERAFDAIVSDFRLPGAWDGLRLIDALRRAEGWRTPAILLSGEFRVESLRDSAPRDVHVLSKPPHLPRLKELLASLALGMGPVEEAAFGTQPAASIRRNLAAGRDAG